MRFLCVFGGSSFFPFKIFPCLQIGWSMEYQVTGNKFANAGKTVRIVDSGVIYEIRRGNGLITNENLEQQQCGLFSYFLYIFSTFSWIDNCIFLFRATLIFFFFHFGNERAFSNFFFYCLWFPVLGFSLKCIEAFQRKISLRL